MLPYQAVDLGSLGLTVDQTRKAAWYLTEEGPRRAGAAAIASALRDCAWPWSWLGLLLLLPPVSWLAAIGYFFVARWRRKLPGTKPACARSWDLDQGAPVAEGPAPACHVRSSSG